jgi:hypothetical protein
MPSAYDTGYADQTGWLQGKTLAEAEHVLGERRATVDHESRYNQGGTDATAAYVAALKAS